AFPIYLFIGGVPCTPPGALAALALCCSLRSVRTRVMLPATSFQLPAQAGSASGHLFRAGSWKLATGSLLFRFSMSRVLAAEATVLAQLEPLARLLLVLRRAVIAAFTLGTRQRDDVSHTLFL